MATRSIPADRAKVTLIDQSNPGFHSVSLVWTDATHRITDFQLSRLGEVAATQDDLLACPPRGWVSLVGACQVRRGAFIKLLPRKLRPKRP